MPKFFISAENFFSDHAIIMGEDVHHIRHVLRLKPGEEIIINCENETNFRTLIETVSASEIRVRVLERLSSSLPGQSSVILVQSIPRHAKMDLILQKATELGVDEIIPLATSRSFVNEQGTVSQGRWIRWQKICQEAAKQCGRDTVPKLHSTIKLSALSRLAEEEGEEGKEGAKGEEEAGGEEKGNVLRLLLWEKEQHNRLKSVLAGYKNNHTRRTDNPDSTDHTDDTNDTSHTSHKSDRKRVSKIFLMVGPEGSLSEEEVQMAVQSGFLPVSCAPWILRTETAAIYALSVIQYEFNF